MPTIVFVIYHLPLLSENPKPTQIDSFFLDKSKDLMKNVSSQPLRELGEVLMETPPGGMVNHFSSRKEKTTSLQQIFKKSLPPLPYPCSELKNFEAIKSHFSKMMAVELQGLKFKWGGAPPDRIK